MAAADIVVQGAREHNLRNVQLVIPRNKLVCFTGVSGSGKSSMAFDTLYAEGQRRYVESLSSYARQFLGQMPKPDVDFISGLSPSISISQKSSGQNPRSTVGTITEIYDFLRVLYARVGTGHCPRCLRPITAQTREQILGQILSLPESARFAILAPVVRGQKGEHRDLFQDLVKQGFVRARVDGGIVMLTDNLRLDRQMRHNIEVVVDRMVAGPTIRARLAESVELALRLGQGNLIVAIDSEASSAPVPFEARAAADDQHTVDSPHDEDGNEAAPRGGEQRGSATQDLHLSAFYACTHCSLSFEPPSPQLFSFNSPRGMCLACDGLGESYTFDPDLLIPDRGRSFMQGCILPIGPWKELGRWRRHIYQGVADTLEHEHQLAAGTILETAWEELPAELQHQLLYGTGNKHITYTWPNAGGMQKYGGQFEGIIPELKTKFRTLSSAVHRRQLEAWMRVVPCMQCSSQRLNEQARAVTLTSRSPKFSQGQAKKSISELCSLSIAESAEFLSELELDPTRTIISTEVLKEIRGRLGFLNNVGLNYLTLNRTAPTLSGGESQRIRLAGQVGCGLVGVLYILDEPSIGLHTRDNDRLLDTLCRLRDLGNTVLVVEHDEDTMRAADAIVDFGPGPGVRGGEVVATGPIETICREPRSVTGKYLSGELRIEVPRERRAIGEKRLKVIGARHHNLRGIDVEIPLGGLVCVTGVSGSGKSSLVNGILVEALRRDLNHGDGTPGAHDRIEGLEWLDKLIAIDQSPIGRTPRSNPSTYIKVFDEIRRLYAQMSESRARGYKEGRFSFNVSGGRCEACEGNGSNRLEMDFLADVWVNCPVCEGRRFNRETLQVRFKEKSISDVLEMDVQQALTHFENIPRLRHMLQTLHDVGLDYLKLGQPSPTLSGGEAQRIKLARELVKRSTGRTLYLLDEPTTGLHFADVQMLLKVLHNFADAGNTVLVVEHNLDVIKTADWVIDLGPEGGAGGGCLVVAGTPEEVAREKSSHTGQALLPLLCPDQNRQHAAARRSRAASNATTPSATVIRVQGARQHNLKNVDVEIPRDQMTVCCGPSGSGKSSLAMDTIYAEGQRRYVESLSSYARQFVGQMQKPVLDHIDGLSPAIAIEQKNLGHTPRSTVGTVTEVYDYLRILFARLGIPHCPQCDLPIGTQSADELIDKIMQHPAGTRLYIMAPLEIDVGEHYEALWEEIRTKGYQRIRVNKVTTSVETPPTIDRKRKHLVEVVVDRITVRQDNRKRVADSVESALDLGRGVLHVAYVEEEVNEEKWKTVVHSQHLACVPCARSFEPLTPHNFSFNSALGWCPACQGLGTQTGANTSALVRDPKLTLAEGAVSLWPAAGALATPMLQALAQHIGARLETPFEKLETKQRRAILHGTGEDWIEVLPPGKTRKAARPLLRFQYKGLYPALEEAARLTAGLRGRLEHLVGEVECSVCAGSRLRDDASAVRFRGQTMEMICRTSLGTLLQQFQSWKLNATEKKIAGELVREVHNRLQFLVDVGLDYLTLSRGAPTLSGGEAQRIRLASQVGSGLTGVLYVLDEPTIGLHARDNKRLLQALLRLRDLGNTLLLVEHDREVIASADQLLDFGPAAGEFGGQIVARGTPAQVSREPGSVTGPYLSGGKTIPIPANRRLASSQPAALPAGRRGSKRAAASAPLAASNTPTTTADRIAPGTHWLEIIGARHNNLRNVDVRLPLGTLTVVSGVSGSGKSSLIEDVLYNSLARTLHRARTFPAAHDALRGVEQINKVIRVDQQPLGNSPSSNPATYTGVFELIRELYSELPEAKLRGYAPRRFSFNVPGGRCERCEGNGQLRIEMHFLPDVWVQCDDCRGARYNPETLAVRFHGQSIADVLDMPCSRALELFINIPKIRRVLQTLCDVGLDYIRLGQAAPTLSGGEAQRVKLAAELSRPDTGKTLYLLDEPTTGLHFDDLARLLEVLNRLVDMGNTVVVIEHNLDVIKTADWIIDLGPEAGAEGGLVVAFGTPEDVVVQARQHLANIKKSSKSSDTPPVRSYTGELLAEVLSVGEVVERAIHDPQAAEAPRQGDMEITDLGQQSAMPWQSDGRRWHTQLRLGRNGQPCRWDGEILSRVVDRIHELGEFSDTNWNHRSIVEIQASRKSDGWFLHAITGEEWLLKLKFRVAKRTFQREDLVARLDLKPLNEMRELPIYGSEPRAQCKNLRGPWQEVQLKVHSLAEVDRPEFWDFLERAVAGFHELTEKIAQRPEDVMPWKVLGQKWHLSRKGFPPGKRVHWELELLEELFELLQETAPSGQFLWNNQQVVHFCATGPGQPWATIHTKRPAAIDLVLNGPKDRFALGRVAALGQSPEVEPGGAGRDLIKLKFQSREEIARGEFGAFLREHLAAVTEASPTKPM